MQQVHLNLALRTIARSLFPLLAFGLCLTALSEQLSAELWQGLPSFLRSIPWQIWVGGLACTAVSFLALGQYDDLAHRQLGSGIPQPQARQSGMIAISLAQIIGFGMLSGAICRWRMLPSLSATGALALSAFVSVSFIAALIVLTAFACLILPAPQGTMLPSIGILLIVPLLIFAPVRWPQLSVGKLSLRLPSLPVTLGIFKWTVVDTLGAAAALWLFLPAGIEMPLLYFFPIFLLALLSAVLCNTPGGFGPFELVLLSCFPDVGANTLMQSIIAYRLVYYAVPACIGMVMLLRPFEAEQERTLPDAGRSAGENAPRSEVGVVRQNGGRIVAFDGGAAAFWSTPQTVTALFSPMLGHMRATLQAVTAEAVRQAKLPLIYKCTAREAVMVRKSGWAIVHVADDALLCPQTFTLDVPARRDLRRKLRAAKKAGVTVSREAVLPLQDMGAIDAEWRANRGPARGGTLGRFCENYVSEQWVAVARLNGVPVAFVSLFTSRQEWCVDLMRNGRDAPNGTMHALIHYALVEAQAENVPRLSLAATPPRRAPKHAVLRYLYGHVVRSAGNSGLTQFKSSFGPLWVPRYAASQHHVGLALGLADIALKVHGAEMEQPARHQMSRPMSAEIPKPS